MRVIITIIDDPTPSDPDGVRVTIDFDPPSSDGAETPALLLTKDFIEQISNQHTLKSAAVGGRKVI
jgi:hypothetical protein